MATLASLSTLRGSQRGAEFLARMLQKSAFLRMMDTLSAWELDASSFDYLVAKAADSIQVRNVGANYTPVASSPGSAQTGTLANYGGGVSVDITHIADAVKGLRNIPSWFAKAVAREADQFATGLEAKCFVGTGSSYNMKGLIKILDGTTDIPGAPTGHTGVVNAASYSTETTPKLLDLVPGTDHYSAESRAFLECLYDTVALVDGAAMLVMNQGMFSRMQTIARTEHILGESRDLFGVPVPTFNGMPMVVVGSTAIVNTEPDDTTTPVNTTTSLYVLAPQEMKLSLVTNSGLDYVEYDWLEAKEAGQEKWEVRLAWKIEDYKAIYRIRNIKIKTAS